MPRGIGYHSSINGRYYYSKTWDPEEDKTLKELVEKYQVTDSSGRPSIPWRRIARFLPKRTSKQCRERWLYNINPEISRKAWSIMEDAVIMKIQKSQGNQWALIARNLPGRTQNSVKTRFRSIQRARTRYWSKEEDNKLLKLYKKYRPKWDQLVVSFPNRKKNALRKRWEQLVTKKGDTEVKPGDPMQIFHNLEMLDKVIWSNSPRDTKRDIQEKKKPPEKSIERDQLLYENDPLRVFIEHYLQIKHISFREFIKMIGLGSLHMFRKWLKSSKEESCGTSSPFRMLQVEARIKKWIQTNRDLEGTLPRDEYTLSLFHAVKNTLKQSSRKRKLGGMISQPIDLPTKLSKKSELEVKDGSGISCKSKEKNEQQKGQKTVKRGRWSPDEHERFFQAFKMYGRKWKKIADYVETRDRVQVRTHASKLLREEKIQQNTHASPVPAASTPIQNQNSGFHGFTYPKFGLQLNALPNQLLLQQQQGQFPAALVQGISNQPYVWSLPPNQWNSQMPRGPMKYQ